MSLRRFVSFGATRRLRLPRWNSFCKTNNNNTICHLQKNTFSTSKEPKSCNVTIEPLSSSSSQDATEVAKDYIVSLGHSERIAKGVIQALTTSGLSGQALLQTIQSLAGRVEVGEDGGLEELIFSVQQEMARTDGKQKVTFYCIAPFSKEKFQMQAYEGMTLTDVARFGGVGDNEKNNTLLGEYIECACSGIMACSTCHVVIDEKWYPAVGKPTEAEQDMIDLAHEPTDTSRLGCQVVLTEKLNGLVFKIPSGANNIMDFIPFED